MNTKQMKSYDIVRKALKNNWLYKPDVCEKCGASVRYDATGKSLLQAHHPDYNNPQKVIWLCVNCHKKLHMKYSGKGVTFNYERKKWVAKAGQKTLYYGNSKADAIKARKEWETSQ